MSAFLRTTSHTLKSVRCFSASAARKDLNKVQLIGRIGADPTITELDADRRVVNYTVATSETRPDKEGNLIKRTQWHRVTSWSSADWFGKVKKGDLVYVEGQLRYSDYTDKEGTPRTKAEIYQSTFKLLTPRNREEQQQ
ncbi:nucleic acid-binding protein [Backusella circina FSU 941]|nr:nucleic acid-binding protein [Backusella circina FSU 941]